MPYFLIKNKFLRLHSRYKRKFFPDRFGGERSNAVVPTPAKCIPELQLVSLKLDNDPSTFVFPLCTRIKRCGGCCISPLLSCQPTATEMRNFEVTDHRRVEEHERKHAYYYQQATREKTIIVEHFFFLVLR